MSEILDYRLKQTILVVDDAPDCILLLTNLLKKSYRIKVATNGETALRVASSFPQPDLILLDINMPGMDGYQICEQLKADPQTTNMPVVFLTSCGKVEEEEKGLRLGAVDYINKPINPSILLARVRTHLTLKNAHRFLEDKAAYLEAEVTRRLRELGAAQDLTILAMAMIAERRDNETGKHIYRTQHYVRLLAQRLRQHPNFAGVFNDTTIELLFKSAPLHDIGKVGVPDSILRKPGPLTAEEFAVMRTHTVIGRDALLDLEREAELPSTFLRFAQEIAYSHHEKWDGTGYPEGLRGTAIPISARLMAVADVYDALTSRRIYKSAMPHEQAMEYIREHKGKHFDPDVVDAFCEIDREIKEIAMYLADASLNPETVP